MHLRGFAHPDDPLIAEWGCNVSPLPRKSLKNTTTSFKLRALLTESGAERLQLART
jgi:hypothetical protein